MIFGGALNNVLAMEATQQLRPMDVTEKEDEDETVSTQGNNEDEEELASELVG